MVAYFSKVGLKVQSFRGIFCPKMGYVQRSWGHNYQFCWACWKISPTWSDTSSFTQKDSAGITHPQIVWVTDPMNKMDLLRAQESGFRIHPLVKPEYWTWFLWNMPGLDSGSSFTLSFSMIWPCPDFVTKKGKLFTEFNHPASFPLFLREIFEPIPSTVTQSWLASGWLVWKSTPIPDFHDESLKKVIFHNKMSPAKNKINPHPQQHPGQKRKQPKTVSVWVFPKIMVPPKWMVKIMEKPY